MVICLYKRKELIVRLFTFILLFLFIYLISYFISYIRYSDKEYVENRGVVLENLILKNELLELTNVSFSKGVVAKVIVRDMYSFYDEIILNVGSDDGVVMNSAVLNDEGLIGIVSRVDKTRCYVKLLSSNYNISIKVEDSYGNYNNGIVNMINKYDDISEGDIVYTSGLDDVIGGLYVGIVKDVKLDKDGLGKELEIEYVNNKHLNYLYIVGNIE